MPTFTQPLTPAFGAFDSQRVEDTLALMAPKWTTWSLQTLAQRGGPMRVRDIATRLPFVSEQFVSKRLAQMQADGLVIRVGDRRGAPYQLSAFGAALVPVHHALADWSESHLKLGPMAGAERVEDALRRLHLRHSTTVIQALGSGPMRFVAIAEQSGLDDSYARARLVRLQFDGLVTRTGPRHGDPYTLTHAGAALGPVYAAVALWYDAAAAARRHTAAPAVAETRVSTGAVLPPEGARSTAALRRSPLVPGALFSPAAQAQPPVPTAVTAAAVPFRGR
ncbi:winged helix-turn-helix transcriptional regulator [Actinacidiphila acididurans]|uniref:Winged helix-turn-helix transcriptional regulator n=1 Tax=Actinacidiphila acididurans TaxID=2784346 RepID=A0ABS2TYE9_9ACTN|nr:winged helix-turn-helix transcriptional regulator [Actinacidiphila acididurans]MBM9508021.1 winged helix-turn-helix transcriptional regulator [Actinacidiphila acididurans]